MSDSPNQAPARPLGLFSAPELLDNYAQLGRSKAENAAWRLFVLGIAAGMIIALGAVASMTAMHGVADPGLARVVSGLIFPFGLGVVMLTGTELFTGNTMMVVSVLGGKTRLGGVLKNWLLVYLGNFAGSLLVAAGVVAGGQLDLGGGALAVHTIRVAAAKCALDPGPALVLGVLCNILVCLGVLCSLSAKDTAGRILGAYLPVALFVISGYEHCVANMYFIPAGLLALGNPAYAALAAAEGLELEALGWAGLAGNLLPVTLGNIIGGAGIACLLWACYCRKKTA